MPEQHEKSPERNGLIGALNSLGTWAKIVVALAPITFAAGGAWVGLTYRVAAMEKSLEKHLEVVTSQQQEKIDTTREQVHDIAKDIDYIKQAIDKNEKANEEILKLLRKKD